MNSITAHLWAIGYDNLNRARQARDVVRELAGPQPYLFLLDTLIVLRNADGSYSVDRESRHTASAIAAAGALGGLVGLVLSIQPLCAAAVGALLASVSSAATSVPLIDEKFVEEVKALMKPGTAALFVLDDAGDMEVIIHNIRGLGGTVLKTNVDMEQMRLVQAALRAESPN